MVKAFLDASLEIHCNSQIDAYPGTVTGVARVFRKRFRSSTVIPITRNQITPVSDP